MNQPTLLKPAQKLFIASDHAGYDLKQYLQHRHPELAWQDLGPDNEHRVDYPDFADKVAQAVLTGQGVGVLICGSGQGMSMRANKYLGIRAALCWNEEVAQLSREHNDANILCMGARLIAPELAVHILDVFLNTTFMGERHQQRVDKLSVTPAYR